MTSSSSRTISCAGWRTQTPAAVKITSDSTGEIPPLTSAAIFIALTIDSHRQFPRLTNAAAIDASVIARQARVHRYNCTNCHTLLGEGAYYAPDLTKITTQRGAAYDAARGAAAVQEARRLMAEAGHPNGVKNQHHRVRGQNPSTFFGIYDVVRRDAVSAAS